MPRPVRKCRFCGEEITIGGGMSGWKTTETLKAACTVNPLAVHRPDNKLITRHQRVEE